MYINTVAGSVMLYLWSDFYNIIFKTKHKLYISSGSESHPPSLQREILGAHVEKYIVETKGKNDLHNVRRELY
jgi:ribosomal 30S subunit maturation factor RimM